MNFFRQLIDFLTLPFRLLFSAPLALISAPRRLMGLSLAARVAVLVAIFLVLCTITAYVAFLFSHKRADYMIWFQGWRIAVILALLVAIPLIVHRALKLWLEGDVSQYPDIDYAWKEGLKALEQHGLNLLHTPVFLILGARDDIQARSLLNASKLSFRLRDTPQGPAALHWYADPAGVYLVCTDTCRLGKLAALAKNAEQFGGGMAAGPTSYGGSSAQLRGTIVPGGTTEPRPFATMMPAAREPEWNVAANLRGTMMAGAGGYDSPQAQAGSGMVALSTADAAEQSARLAYVCTLLRRARQPLCPLNGILTLLPFSLIQRSSTEAVEVQRAVKEDLATIRRIAKLRCPVTALVVGMESENGFRELIRRVGADRAKVQRFGKGFNVWNPPVGEQIEAVARHACGAFEDWVYTLFREADGFNQTGNTKLYALLCKIRSDLHSRLTNVLVAAYAHDAQPAADREPLLFSGCYFAATGETDDRQAFVKSVFEKLIEQENELAWTDEALAENDRYRRWARVSLGISGVLAACLIGMVVVYWYRQ
jgi:hypothetical protein